MDDVKPAAKGRRARCAYFGNVKPWRNHGPIYGGGACENGGKGCQCEVPSNTPDLPFFEPAPDAEFDRFYCGCAGWD